MLLGSGGICASTANGAALAPQHRAPEVVRILGEDVLRERLLDDPRLLGDLALELAGAPAGVAGEDAGAIEAADVGGALDLGRQEADRAEHEGRRLVRVAEVAEHDDRLGLHGPADVDEVGVVDEIGERRHRVGDGDRRGPVEDHAHRALVAVLADEEDAAAEVRVEQVGPGDEQLSAE